MSGARNRYAAYGMDRSTFISMVSDGSMTFEEVVERFCAYAELYGFPPMPGVDIAVTIAGMKRGGMNLPAFKAQHDKRWDSDDESWRSGEN